MTDLSVSSELLTSNKASLISSRSSSTPGEAAGVVVGTGISGPLALGAAVAAASSTSLSSASAKARASSPYPISSSGISNSHGSGGGLEPHTSSGGVHTSSSISHSTTTGSNTHHHHHHHQGQVQGAAHPSSTHHHLLHNQQHHPPPHPHHLSQQPSPMEVFNLRWDEYHRIVIDSFWSLFTEESLVDCTLVCSPTETVKVHRIVLSANSPYFRSLLATHTAHPHPIIILHDVRYSILKMLITFMYRGEVNVLPEEMTSLLKTAESLQILGLCSSQNSHTVTTTTMTTTTVLKRKASSARSSGASTPFEPAAAVSLQHAQTPVLTTISNSNASSPPLTSVVTGENRSGNVGGGGNHAATPNNNSSATIQQAVYSKKARILEQQHHHHHFPAHHHHHGINHGPYHGSSGGPVGAYNSSSSSSPGTPVASGTPTGQNWVMDQPLALKKEDSRSPSPSTPSPPPESPPPTGGGVRRDDPIRDDSYHHNIRMSRTSSPSELLRRSTSSSPKPGWVGAGRDVQSPPSVPVPPAHSNMYQHHNQQPHHHHQSHHHQQHPHNLRKLSGQSSVSRGGPVDDAFVDEDDEPEYEDLSRGANTDRGGGGRDTRPMINDADMNASDEEEDDEETVHHPQSRNSLDLASSSRSSSTSGINLIQGASHMDQDPAVLCLRYCCPYCSTNFPSQSSLSRHIMILHPTVYSALYANAPPGGPVPPSSTSPILETAHNLVKHSSHNSNDGSGGLPLENHHPHPHHHLPPGHPSYEKGGSGDGRSGSTSGMIAHDPQGGGGGSSSSSTSGQQSSIVCKFCGKPFPEVSQLIQHLPIHTGERPFKCEFCGKAFKLRHHMKDHARVHTGERPFRCSLCGKTFSRSTILKAHEKTHFPKGAGPPNNGPAEGSNGNGNSGAESRGGGGSGFKL